VIVNNIDTKKQPTYNIDDISLKVESLF